MFSPIMLIHNLVDTILHNIIIDQGHVRAWPQFELRHKRVWAHSCMCTFLFLTQSCLCINVSGLKRVRAQTCVGTNVCGHKRVWAQTCEGTNVSGHKHIWAKMCLGTVIWSQSRWHNHVWAQFQRGGTVLSSYSLCVFVP